MGKIDVIPLFPLVGVNYRQPLLHMSTIMLHIYSTDERINRFSNGYMINSSLRIDRVFREKN